MSDELIELVNSNKNNLNTNSGLNKISELVDDLIEKETWDKSLKIIVQIFKEQKWDKRTIQIILSFCNKNLKDLDSVFIIATKYYILKKDDLKFLFKNLDLSDLKTLLKKYIELRDNLNYHILGNNLVGFYEKDLSGEEYEELFQYTNYYQNKYNDRNKIEINLESVKDYFIHKKGIYLYAEIPSWVSIKEGENLSLLLTVNPGLVAEDAEGALEKIVKKAKDYFYITPDILKEEKEADDEEEGVILKPELNDALLQYLKASSLQEDESSIHTANRVFGPANRFEKKNCISNPGKSGPCRMLECVCREFEEDYPEEWFFGSCDNYFCKKKIRDRSHAVRVPVEEGGWKGCFCSFECLENNLAFKSRNMSFRLEAMRVSINEDGIMDRTKT
jgi:hypothetical protein